MSVLYTAKSTVAELSFSFELKPLSKQGWSSILPLFELIIQPRFESFPSKKLYGPGVFSSLFKFKSSVCTESLKPKGTFRAADRLEVDLGTTLAGFKTLSPVNNSLSTASSLAESHTAESSKLLTSAFDTDLVSYSVVPLIKRGQILAEKKWYSVKASLIKRDRRGIAVARHSGSSLDATRWQKRGKIIFCRGEVVADSKLHQSYTDPLDFTQAVFSGKESSTSRNFRKSSGLEEFSFKLFAKNFKKIAKNLKFISSLFSLKSCRPGRMCREV